MADRPLVSVCITTYQHGRFIAEALDSVLMQQGDFDLEILLGEDASTDGTREICIDYAARHPEIIKLLLHERETMIRIGGRATGRYNFLKNYERIAGDFVCFLDGDDAYLGADRLAVQLAFLRDHPDHSGVGGMPIYVTETHWWPHALHATYDHAMVLRHAMPSTGTVMFRRSALPEKLEDWLLYEAPVADAFLLALATRHGSLKMLDRPVSIRRVHAGGVWSMLDLAKQHRLLQSITEIQLAYVAEEEWQRAVLLEVLAEDKEALRAIETPRAIAPRTRVRRWARAMARRARGRMRRRRLPLPASVRRPA